MKLLLDDNISRHTGERLRHAGHTIVRCRDVAAGKPDSDVQAIAHEAGLIVLTEDVDFASLVMREHLPSVGIILLRLTGIERGAQPEYVAQAIATHANAIPGSFTVIMPSGARSRPLPLT
ncbi:MAG: DUF5615 family PIN-like protein [Ktedonobacterales bacterium]